MASNPFFVESEHIYLGEKFKGKVDDKCLMKSMEFLNNVISENGTTRYVHFEDKTFCVITYPLLGPKFSAFNDPCILTIIDNEIEDDNDMVIEILYFRSKMEIGKLDEYLDDSLKEIILEELSKDSTLFAIRSMNDIGRLVCSYDYLHSVNIGRFEFVLSKFETTSKQVITSSCNNSRYEVKIWIEMDE